MSDQLSLLIRAGNPLIEIETTDEHRKGRDHNPFVFTNWLAGGGVHGGVSYGESDPWSYKPAEPDKPTYCYDIHATVLNLLGIDHEKLTFHRDGIDRRLTDVHGHVIEDIVA